MTSKTHRGLRNAALGLLAVGGMLGMGLSAPASATAPGSEGKIAFVRANQIYTMTKAGGTVKQLTTVGKNYRPRWSPDGKHIAYIQEDVNGNRNVFEMTATGTNKTKVTSSGTVTTAPVWSPDGQTLAFGAVGVWQVPPTQTAPGFDWTDQWVYLVRATAPFGTPSLLKVYESFSSDPVADQEAINVFGGTSLAWSPNGADLAVVNNHSEDSPNIGLHLVHTMTNATPGDGALHVENVIRKTGGDCCGRQQWSDLDYIPNGVLGFAAADSGDEFQWDPPQLTLTYPGFVSQLGDKAGAPSPNGKHMVFVRTTGTTPNVWTATITGAQRKMIMANAYQPDWQPLP
jgi:dipeptidyl aminopeptidase/acylaminoacyl peptidase